MIRVEPPPEPPTFDSICRRPGNQWLKEHPAYERPRDYWSGFEPQLREAFSGRCGWCAMLVMRGQVDHFIPIAKLRKTRRDQLAYEWSNLRYIDAWINQKKRDAEVIDPYLVEDGWFEILLPSLQLQPTEKLPPNLHEIARFTLQRLGLQDGEVVVRYRREWFERYQLRELPLDGLRSFAPLIAIAVQKDLERGIDWRIPVSDRPESRG